MDITKSREGLFWLYNNGYQEDVELFLSRLGNINRYAIRIGYSTNPDDWSSMLQRNCRQMQKIDTLYFVQKDEHIFRTFNATNKEDMLNWIQEVNKIVFF